MARYSIYQGLTILFYVVVNIMMVLRFCIRFKYPIYNHSFDYYLIFLAINSTLLFRPIYRYMLLSAICWIALYLYFTQDISSSGFPPSDMFSYQFSTLFLGFNSSIFSFAKNWLNPSFLLFYCLHFWIYFHYLWRKSRSV